MENAYLNKNKECVCDENSYYDEKSKKCFNATCPKDVPLCVKCNLKGKCIQCKQRSFYNDIFNACLCFSQFYHNVLMDVCQDESSPPPKTKIQNKCEDYNSYFDTKENKCICNLGYSLDITLNKCFLKNDNDQTAINKKKTCTEGKKLCKTCLGDICIKCNENANINFLSQKCECVKNHFKMFGKCISKIINYRRHKEV